MKSLVTGGAGFIGSHLVDALIEEGNDVIVLDNLSNGRKEFIHHHLDNTGFRFYQVDLLKDEIDGYFEEDVDEVWHLAANVEVRKALQDARIDINQNILVTHKVSEAMRKSNIKRVLFTSSSTVYGEAEKIPTPENYPCRPTSLYGSTKLSSEALISAYVHTFDISAIIFRLSNVTGQRSTHGVVFDFVKKLRKNPLKLEILGDGTQKKSYLYIEDCIEAMLSLSKNLNEELKILNIGSEDWIEVEEIANIVCKRLNLNPELKFGKENKGWRGDIPKMLLDITKVKKLGWRPKYNSKEAIILTVDWLKGIYK